MAYERITSYIEGYYKTEIDLIENRILIENRDNMKDIVCYLADNFKIINEDDYDMIARDFNGLREIETLWDKYCSKRYGRGDYIETIFLVAYEMASLMKGYAKSIADEKIDMLILNNQKVLPPDTSNNAGDFAYPL